MKNTQKSAKRQYKSDVKRFLIYWIILLPVVVALVVGLSYTSLSSPLRILISVVCGITICAIIEIIRFVIISKRKEKPAKADPFAD